MAAVRVGAVLSVALCSTSRNCAGVDLGEGCGLVKGDAGEAVRWRRVEPGKNELGEMEGE
jgi:hypothetical protein